jgi:hypothetical protein
LEHLSVFFKKNISCHTDRGVLLKSKRSFFQDPGQSRPMCSKATMLHISFLF